MADHEAPKVHATTAQESMPAAPAARDVGRKDSRHVSWHDEGSAVFVTAVRSRVLRIISAGHPRERCLVQSPVHFVDGRECPEPAGPQQRVDRRNANLLLLFTRLTAYERHFISFLRAIWGHPAQKLPAMLALPAVLIVGRAARSRRRLLSATRQAKSSWTPAGFPAAP